MARPKGKNSSFSYYSEETIKKAIEFYKTHTLTETLMEIGCSPKTLYMWLDEANIPRKGRSA